MQAHSVPKWQTQDDFERKTPDIHRVNVHVFTPSPIFRFCCHLSFQVTKETEQAFDVSGSEYLQECKE